MERSLHDGAQQRLVGVALSLQLADRRIDDKPDEAHTALARAAQELTESLAEPRGRRGLHPAVLTDPGPPAAVSALAQHAPIPVELTIDAGERPPEPVEVAAFHAISESLTSVAKYARATVARVEVRTLGDRLLVDVATTASAAPTRAAARACAASRTAWRRFGGRLHVVSVPERTHRYGPTCRWCRPARRAGRDDGRRECGAARPWLVARPVWAYDAVREQLAGEGVEVTAIDLAPARSSGSTRRIRRPVAPARGGRAGRARQVADPILISASDTVARVVLMTRIELVQERGADGTVVLRPVVIGPVERFRRLLRRLAPSPRRSIAA